MKFLVFLIPVLCVVCSGCSNQNTAVKNPPAKESGPDWEITAKVKALILGDMSISVASRFVTVNTQNGVVTLTGEVTSRDDMNRIVNTARAVEGVKKVDNQMTVKSN